MTSIVRRNCHAFADPEKLSPGGDLWRHAPVKDADGRLTSDLMILFPGLQQEHNLRIMIRQQLQEVLQGFGDQVIFADFNIRLGVLWVTVTSEPGLCSEVAQAIHARIEGARIVGNYIKCPEPARLAWMAKVKRLLT